MRSLYLDRDKRSSSRSGRRESDKSSKRANNTSERYWNNSNREEEAHDRTRPKHSASAHEGKGSYLYLPQLITEYAAYFNTGYYFLLYKFI